MGSSDQPNSEDARSLLEDHPTWGRVLLLKTSELRTLHRYAKSLAPDTEALLDAATRLNQRFAHATRAPGSRPVFVLVADSNGQAKELITEFIGFEVTFSGLALAKPRTPGGSGPRARSSPNRFSNPKSMFEFEHSFSICGEHSRGLPSAQFPCHHMVNGPTGNRSAAQLARRGSRVRRGTG